MKNLLGKKAYNCALITTIGASSVTSRTDIDLEALVGNTVTLLTVTPFFLNGTGPHPIHTPHTF